MVDRRLKRRLSRLVSVRLVNPVVRRLLEWGVLPPTQALLETTGRRTGAPRRVPVGNGLRGREFWIVCEHGRASHYVQNVEADARVRVKVGRRWYTGEAHVLDDDDPEARLRWLARPLNDAIVRLAGSDLLTVRIDLDPSA